MNKLILYLMVSSSIFFSYSSQAENAVHPEGVGIAPGETRIVVIETLGASTASDVFFINMAGVTAEIIDANIFNFNQVSIRLTADADANVQVGATGDLVLKLPLGDTVIPVTIFCLSNAVISAPSSALTGQLQRVEIHGCLADHLIGFTIQGRAVAIKDEKKAELLQLNPENNSLYIDIQSQINEDHSAVVDFIQSFEGGGSLGTQQKRSIEISFKKDDLFDLPEPTVDIDYLSSDDNSVVRDSINGENSITT